MAKTEKQIKDDAAAFDGYESIPGLEHLGRHIVDAAGNPSGSPANFEHVRGRGARGSEATKEDQIEKLKKEFSSFEI